MKTRSTLRVLLVTWGTYFFGCNTGRAEAPAAARPTTSPLQLIQRIPRRVSRVASITSPRILSAPADFAALGNNTVEVVNSFEAR